ncbi:TetR/AcrR family transcriptional regulator [Mycolicibacterium holsaticum]|jgi:DNA-binding transcriptional regulator YbjK|uniref:TetR/AcrR family transcriptional regulator n=2 Tax=Mycolicibacterium holsaticum TaxID=152142 RepID=UPI001C7CF50D|nr:TetR family transcriptional regulator [Mycolicibacterium holsaticum]MDA4108025.1 TetR family transcriptional regulator [Mycolicibacterium holsaticum DSM 44478 = JCM 12374]QZA14554.1 TetR family transcriptional regulator [Mycolicibacterium holsaticum DSM 44478 = JCM 12374]UNC08000.1 TetR family transcriptional regulator [Mycolicibacterium holsaticum DSM 44478 = JCM 12374]
MATRRTPDGRQRRRELCDAGIRLLAEHGAKGLSHPRVDRQAGVPDGSASYYFRTRAALIHAVAERVAELDLADLRSVTEASETEADTSQRDAVTKLAAVVMKSLTGDGLIRTRARIELLLQAGRDPAISDVFRASSQTYLRLHRELAERSQPANADPSAVDDRALLTVMFISGLMLSAAGSSQPVITRDRLELLLTQIADSGS